MTTVEVSAKLTIEDLIAAVAKLPPHELAEFTRQVIAIQSQRNVPLLVDDEEDALLEAIQSQRLADEEQRQLNELREKNRAGTLTPAEQATLLNFVQRVEKQDLARVEKLIELARKRDTTVSQLIKDLGLEPTYA